MSTIFQTLPQSRQRTCQRRNETNFIGAVRFFLYGNGSDADKSDVNVCDKPLQVVCRLLLFNTIAQMPNVKSFCFNPPAIQTAFEIKANQNINKNILFCSKRSKLLHLLIISWFKNVFRCASGRFRAVRNVLYSNSMHNLNAIASSNIYHKSLC